MELEERKKNEAKYVAFAALDLKYQSDQRKNNISKCGLKKNFAVEVLN